MATALVETRINYFTPPVDGSKPYMWATANYPSGGPMLNWETLEHNVQVENLRGNETSPEYRLDTAGFEFHLIPNKATIDFSDDEDIKEKYYAESIENIKKITGASRVVIFDHTLRKPRPAGTPETPENRSPAKLAHVDQTHESAKHRVELHLPKPDVPALLSKRYQIVNLWRPIANPAWQFPLALCDFRTVQDSDFVPSTVKYLDRDGETLSVKFNPEHKWKYVASMTPDEFVLIKCFDSEKDVAMFTPHAAFDDPNTPADAPDRQSIEVRALVFYE